jgi:hypothetical protein
MGTTIFQKEGVKARKKEIGEVKVRKEIEK